MLGIIPLGSEISMCFDTKACERDNLPGIQALKVYVKMFPVATRSCRRLAFHCVISCP